MPVWPVTIDAEWHERLKARLMERVRQRRQAQIAQEDRVDMLDPAVRSRLEARCAPGRTIDDPDMRALLAAYDAATQARAALLEYARHKAECAVYVVGTYYAQPGDCTCGFAAYQEAPHAQ